MISTEALSPMFKNGTSSDTKADLASLGPTIVRLLPGQ